MTRRTFATNILSNSSDADGGPVTLAALGISPAVDVIDWGTIPYVRTDIVPGVLEFYPNGTIIHEDQGDTSLHPAEGVTTTPVILAFRTADDVEMSDDIGTMPITLEGVMTGATTPPVLTSTIPLVGSTGNSVTTDISLIYDESIQEGTGTVELFNVGTGLLIQSFAIPGDLGMGEGQLYLSNDRIVVNPTGNLPAGVQVSARVSAGAVRDLAGTDCAAVTGDAVFFETFVTGPSVAYPDDPDGFRGQELTFAYPTTGDYIVDAAGGGDFVDLAGASAVATAGQSVRVKATGVYREMFNFADGVAVTAFGTDRPLVSAQEPLTGFVQCTPADAATIGPILGVAGNPADAYGTPVFKRTGIPRSAVYASSLVGINPMVNGEVIFPSVDRGDPSRVWSQEDEALAHDATANGGSFVTSGSTITGINDPTVITSGKYTAAQLLAARVRVIVSPNEFPLLNITGVNLTTNTINVDGGRVVDGSGRRKYSIVNVGPALVDGTFFFVDNGATFDLYIRIANVADIDKVSIAARPKIITLPSGGSNMLIGGIHFEGASGDLAPTDGSAICDVSNGVTTNGLTIENCRFKGFLNTAVQHHAAVHLVRVDNILAEYNTFEDCSGHGIFPNGSLVTTNNCTIRRNVFVRIGSAPAKAYRCSNYSFLHNLCIDCGFRAHGNLGNVYISGLRPTWWGNENVRCQGYYTAQAIIDWMMGFNWAPTYSKYNTPGVNLDNRKIYPQGTTGNGYAFNNSCPCVTDGVGSLGHLAMNPSDAGLTSLSVNNETHGHVIPQDAKGPLTTAYNLITHDGYSGLAGGAIDPSDFTGAPGKFSTTDQLELDLAATYADYVNGDWSPAGPGSKLLTMGTHDIAPTVNAWWAANSALPLADKFIDAKGQPINYAALKIGAIQSR